MPCWGGARGQPTHHESVAQSRMPNIMTHRSNHQTQNILRCEHLPCPPRALCTRLTQSLVVSLPNRPRCGTLVTHEIKGRDDANGQEESIGRLEYVNGMDVIVVRVRGVIDGADGEKESVHPI